MMILLTAPWLAACPPPLPPSPPDPLVVIDAPLSGIAGLQVTFRWHLDHPADGETYRYEVRLDNGVDACDNVIEQAFPADTRLCLAVTLPPAIYAEANVDVAVRAIDCRGRLFCTRGPRLTVSADGPISSSC